MLVIDQMFENMKPSSITLVINVFGAYRLCVYIVVRKKETCLTLDLFLTRFACLLNMRSSKQDSLVISYCT